MSASVARSRHVVVVGAGGNIGSHLVPHLARMPEIGRLTLVDRDRYEDTNLDNQAVTASAIHHRKAVVQASVARRINPNLAVRALAEWVEDVPLALLRADLILACLDSRRARQVVNEAAVRLGVPWIDAGVLADGLLARISAFRPSPNAPCLECAWDATDYAAIEQAYPCRPADADPPRTNAPSSLGALAAALQAMACAEILAGEVHSFASVAELVIGTAPHCHYRTAHRHNPGCRLGLHDAWVIEPLTVDPAVAALRDLGDAVSSHVDSIESYELSVGRKFFAHTLTCSACGATRPTLVLRSSQRGAFPTCKRCSNAMTITGLGVTEHLDLSSLSARDLGQSCTSIGFRVGEVITVSGSTGERHFELAVPLRDHVATRERGDSTAAVA